jgi:hypothetical protein
LSYYHPDNYRFRFRSKGLYSRLALAASLGPAWIPFGATGYANVRANASPKSGEASPRFFMSSFFSNWSLFVGVNPYSTPIRSSRSSLFRDRSTLKPFLHVAPHLCPLVHVPAVLGIAPKVHFNTGDTKLFQSIDHTSTDSATIHEDSISYLQKLLASVAY